MSNLPTKLTSEEVQANLKNVEGWELSADGKELNKTFTFKGYWKTIAFVNSVAWIAQAAGHHPDLSVHYGKVIVTYTTHDIDGLSQNDFDCITKIEAL